MYNTASVLYNGLLRIYFDEYYELPDVKRNKITNKYDPKQFFLKAYNYEVWLENEESTDKEEFSNLPPCQH